MAVKASSVNPLDWKIRRGDLKLVTGRSFPKILGADFAGIIEHTFPLSQAEHAFEILESGMAVGKVIIQT